MKEDWSWAAIFWAAIFVVVALVASIVVYVSLVLATDAARAPRPRPTPASAGCVTIVLPAPVPTPGPVSAEGAALVKFPIYEPYDAHLIYEALEQAEKNTTRRK